MAMTKKLRRKLRKVLSSEFYVNLEKQCEMRGYILTSCWRLPDYQGGEYEVALEPINEDIPTPSLSVSIDKKTKKADVELLDFGFSQTGAESIIGFGFGGFDGFDSFSDSDSEDDSSFEYGTDMETLKNSMELMNILDKTDWSECPVLM